MEASQQVTSSAETRERDGWLTRSLVVFCLSCLAVTAVAALVQVRYGSYPMTWSETITAVFDRNVWRDPAVWNAFLLDGELPQLDPRSLVVWTIRMPRVIVAVLAGAALAVSGAIFQAVTRNELASPFVLGVSSGAGFAVLATLVVFSGLTPYLPFVAALGGATAFLIVYAIAWKGGTSPLRLVLAGVIVNMIFHSLQRGLYFFADDIGTVQTAMAWVTGSLTGVGWEQVRIALLPTVVSIALALFAARQLNVLLLGETTARSLGMRVERVRLFLSGVGILAASAAIAVAGVVGFFGLVIPHIVRNVVGTDYRQLMVGCLFAGPALMVTADVGARLALQPAQIPVGVVTGLLGGPYFLYLMRKRDSMGEL